MAGYLDTKKLIEDTLVGRPAGTMIYPDGHQNFALQMLDYIRSIELLGSSVLQGIATPDTVPVQPNNAKVSYIATVPIATTATFLYFYDENGDRIVVTNDSNTVSVVILIWNCLYWSAQVMQIQVSNMGGQYYGFYPSSDDLPDDASAPGYAYVGASEPFAVWNFNGSVWSDSGSTINGISGEPGRDGVGFQSVSTAQDGTIVITLTNGDTITIDLNHEHPSYYSKNVENVQPSGGFLPDVFYELGTLTGSVTFSLASAVSGQVNHYFWTFTAGSTAPTITWPNGITWVDYLHLLRHYIHFEILGYN